MRWSINVVAVKVVTPWASIRSTIRAASNFWSTTRWSPASRLKSVAKPLVWYIGAITRTTCGRATGPHDAANGMPTISSKTPGLSIRMTLGAPVEPLLQMPLVCGDTTDGRGVCVVIGGRLEPRQVVGADRDAVDHLEHALALPVGEVPAHRHGDGAELPRRQHGHHELGRVAQADGDAGAGGRAPRLECSGDLRRAAVQLGPGDDRLAAVDRGHAQHR